MKVHIWDVQHGSALWIRTPNDLDFVVDMGVGSHGAEGEFSPLTHLRQCCNVGTIDGLIITHPHADHIADIQALTELRPTTLVRPKHLSADEIRGGNRSTDEGLVEQYLSLSARYAEGVSAEANPFLPQNNGGVKIETFTPTFCPRTNLNNHSLVTVVQYENTKLLIPGDNETCSWRELLGRHDFRAAIQGTNLLVAPHHGRESGYYDELFEHISPYITIVSDGRHCDTSATDRYSKASKGWTVHRTNGEREERRCLTTRKDHHIVIDVGGREKQGLFEITTHVPVRPNL